MSDFLHHWYFHLPDAILAVLIYASLGRLVLSTIVPAYGTNSVWRALVSLTAPPMKVVNVITPVGMPASLVLVFCILWLMLLRVVFFLTMGAWGLLPATGAAT